MLMGLESEGNQKTLWKEKNDINSVDLRSRRWDFALNPPHMTLSYGSKCKPCSEHQLSVFFCVGLWWHKYLRMFLLHIYKQWYRRRKGTWGGYKKALRTPGSKETIDNVNAFRARREAKHIMEAKTALTLLIFAICDKILVWIVHIWHYLLTQNAKRAVSMNLAFLVCVFGGRSALKKQM